MNWLCNFLVISVLTTDSDPIYIASFNLWQVAITIAKRTILSLLRKGYFDYLKIALTMQYQINTKESAPQPTADTSIDRGLHLWRHLPWNLPGLGLCEAMYFWKFILYLYKHKNVNATHFRIHLQISYNWLYLFM